MRITYQRTGGIVGVSDLPLVVDTDQLSEADGSLLSRLVTGAHFFDWPVNIGTTDPDAYQEHITIEDHGRTYEVTLSDPVTDPGLQALAGELRARWQRQHGQT